MIVAKKRAGRLPTFEQLSAQLRVLDHDTTTKEVSDMMNVITRRPTRLAAAAAISTLALATPTLAASAHVPCGKHKAHHTNCGKHLGASKGKKKGHSK